MSPTSIMDNSPKSRARPLRTVLFSAGSIQSSIEAAAASGTDGLVIDVEEPETPYTPEVRERARAQTGEFLASRSPDEGPAIFVRVQPPSTGQTLADLRAVMHPALTGIMLPKVTGAHDVIAADALLTNVETDLGRDVGTTAIYPILETAQGLRLAYEIATASERVAYLGGAVSRFGDICQALRFRWTPEGQESLFLRSKVLVDARAAGIRYPVSGMWGGDNDDLDGLIAWANQLRDLGYFGMMLGEPSHVPLVKELFTPTSEDISYWQDLDQLAADAEARGVGPITYGDPNQGEGHVVHIAHVGSARLGLQWARDLGVID